MKLPYRLAVIPGDWFDVLKAYDAIFFGAVGWPEKPFGREGFPVAALIINDLGSKTGSRISLGGLGKAHNAGVEGSSPSLSITQSIGYGHDAVRVVHGKRTVSARTGLSLSLATASRRCSGARCA